MLDFIQAATPWVAMGIFLAVFFAGNAKKDAADYRSQGIALGMCFGVAIGTAWGNLALGLCVGTLTGLLVGSCKKKPHTKADNCPK